MPEDFVVRPGVGVGRVLIGSNRSEVLALLGTMKRILILIALSLLLCSTASAFQGGAGESIKKANPTTTSVTKPDTASRAKPGFYIKFDMCHACAYAVWQKDTISALARAGIKAFVSDVIRSHYTEQSYWTLKSLRLRRVGNEGWLTPVYAGPFESELSARQTFSRLPAILTPVFDEIDKRRAEIGDTTTHWSRSFDNCSGKQCDIYGFFVQLVRVSG